MTAEEFILEYTGSGQWEQVKDMNWATAEMLDVMQKWEVVKMLGVGECESVCGHKFDTSGRQLTIPDVIKSVCEICKQPLTDEEIKTGHCFNCGEQDL